jgi:hypothetical protein
MTRYDDILSQVLIQTTDRDAAIDCTAVYFAGCYGREYAGERYSDDQLVDRILCDIAQVSRFRAA